MIRWIGTCAACVFVFVGQWAEARTETRFRDFVEIAPGRELYVDWIKAEPGKPTVVLLNGMTYSTSYWESFATVLAEKGIGVLRYDMYGMGNTLLKDATNGLNRSPFQHFEAMIYTALGFAQTTIDRLVSSPIMNPIRIPDQVQDLKLLLDKLGQAGKVNFVGLSYGGAVGLEFAAQYPERVNSLIVQAPYTEAMTEQVEYIKRMILWTRIHFPANPASDRTLYDFWLRVLVYTTYPKVEPSVLDNVFKLEATYRLAQGATDWLAADTVNRLPAGKIHLMIAGQDQYIKRPVLENFWNSIPATARASKVILAGTEHKIPEAEPRFSANWVAQILAGNPVMANGTAFDADPRSGVVRYPGGELKLSLRPDLRPTAVAPDGRPGEVIHGAISRSRINCRAAHAVVR